VTVKSAKKPNTQKELDLDMSQPVCARWRSLRLKTVTRALL